MPLFSSNQSKLEKIKESAFKNESEIQKITEANLLEIFGLELVKREISFDDLRADTLAFNEESKAFVIIEYKIGTNYSVIDQGYAYLASILNKKEACVLEYNNVNNKQLKANDIDWSQSRVFFISPEFTKYQSKAIGFRDLPFELWKISKFDNGLISFIRLESAISGESIAKFSPSNETVKEVSKEIKVYTEQDHLDGMPESIAKTYQKLKERIFSLDEGTQIRPRRLYIAFLAKSIFASVWLQKASLKLFLNLEKGQLNDPKKVARDMSNTGHWANGDYEITIKPQDDLDYIISLVKQSLDKHS